MRYRWKLICIPEKAGMRQNRGASKMKIIGITGGIGTGKSLVLDYLKESYGAVCCQADEVAKRLQRKGTKCYKRIVEHFGEGILDEEGRLNRSRLAGIVFSNPAELRILNEIVHPAVKEKNKRTDPPGREKRKVLCLCLRRLFLLKTIMMHFAMNYGTFIRMMKRGKSV